MSYKDAIMSKAGQAPQSMKFVAPGLSVQSGSASLSKQQDRQVAFAENIADNEGKSIRNRSERKKHASKDKVPLVSETKVQLSDKSSVSEPANLVSADQKSLYSGGIDTVTETGRIGSPEQSEILGGSSKSPKLVEADKDVTKRNFLALTELAHSLSEVKEQYVVLDREKFFTDSIDKVKVLIAFADNIKVNLNVAVSLVDDEEVIDEDDDLATRMF